MATTSLPATRIGRGIKLHREHSEEITHEGRGVYTVPGCSGGTYTVDLAVFGGEESCDCPDRAKVCKHLVAAGLYRAKITAKRRTEAEARREARKAVQVNLAALAAGIAW
jgi:uncharacterized Zn finger protein